MTTNTKLTEEAYQFIADRPESLSDDLYQWAVDAEIIICDLCKALTAAAAPKMSLAEFLKQPDEVLQPFFEKGFREAGRMQQKILDEAATLKAAKAEPPLPEGWRYVAVNGGFDALMFWLDRCEQKGHLDNCPDLVEPWEAFEYRETEPAQQPAQQLAHKKKLKHKKILKLAEKAGIVLSPAQFSGVLETETDEYSLARFAELAVESAHRIKPTHKEQAK